MTDFMLSQCLVAAAICFDLASFQFRDRRAVVACLCAAGLLIASHFLLLDKMTAAALMLLASARYLVCIFSTARIWLGLFLLLATTATFLTYGGPLSLLALAGSSLQTLAAFEVDDRRLRLGMMAGTTLWLLNNALQGSPMAVLMEVLFLASNLVGYYRHYLRPAAL
ncbi:YgjV family protein [Gallaecimonas sp. GXIMD4217]|uniref:YgjV family protein n=1 Tax=Gallaecimonas sp. GXIMD4217 TaxID=3131927 RepID=UPI00311B2A14